MSDSKVRNWYICLCTLRLFYREIERWNASERWSLGQIQFTSHVNASETFYDALGTDFVCGHISDTAVLQMCVLQNNESVVKPQENPSIHPSVILPGVTGLLESIPAATRWEAGIQASMNVHVFALLFLFLLHECLGLIDYTTVTHSSRNVSVWVCLLHRFYRSPDMNKPLYREIFILAVL